MWLSYAIMYQGWNTPPEQEAAPVECPALAQVLGLPGQIE